MKLLPLAFSLALAFVTLPLSFVPVLANTGNLNIPGGLNLNSSAEDVPSVAVDLTWGLDDWPVLINPYFSASWDNDWQYFDGEEVVTVDYACGSKPFFASGLVAREVCSPAIPL